MTQYYPCLNTQYDVIVGIGLVFDQIELVQVLDISDNALEGPWQRFVDSHRCWFSDCDSLLLGLRIYFVCDGGSIYSCSLLSFGSF